MMSQSFYMESQNFKNPYEGASPPSKMISKAGKSQTSNDGKAILDL